MKIGTPGNIRQECVQCSVKNCASCSPTPLVCHQCIRGYFNDSKPIVTQFQKIEKCTQCPENCDICSSKDSCEICKYGYEFQEAHMVDSRRLRRILNSGKENPLEAAPKATSSISMPVK